MTPKHSSPNRISKQPVNNKLIRQSSSASTIQRRNQNMIYQRRQNIGTNNDLLNQHTPSIFSVPLLTGVMNDFFQATKIMEDEIMLPSRLKDMPVEEGVLDNSVQPNNWHELYTFVRDIRNQLTRSRPFIDNDSNSTKQQIKDSNDDEEISIASYDTTQHSSSSSSSNVSLDEFEQSTTSTTASFDTIKDELQCHLFGLLGSLDNLKILADRVTERYQEDSTFIN
ncbi:unnamed protein product [Rotaria sordida]|uniref:Uncharacterized protein n=1 Tax=Rotaria sordida TaxID=392033 RepID=A0A813MWE2_9BILA|nr:unnamed protein product [Rotaria sordida]CAF0741790.1 unnamed protein product [Rotaria sordida]CAF0787734.1 unnamed protein product [Rotaria sordida]CAF0795628.1 unnamed protein product [Rotaria sordida]CAF3622572.1 unnamed protein product [Rotaria sordida]